MTITFYILLTFLNWTEQRKKFDKKRMETKMNWFFGIYTTLITLMFGLSIFFFFVSTITFVFTAIITVWFILEWITDKAILIYGMNKIILHKEFMGVNKESLKEAEELSKLNKNHHK